MEVNGGRGNKFFVFLSELLGTAFLLISINWASTSDSVPQAVGLTVMVMAQIFGPISGGHFNPAVTIGMLWKEGKENFAGNLCFGFFIIICQGLGAMLGCAICIMAFPFKKKDIKEIPIGTDDFWVAQLCPVNGCNDDGDNVLRVFAVETVCTFMFVTFVLVIVKHNGAQDMPINAMAIGLALYCCVREASGISGGCINPAVGLVQSVFQKMANDFTYPQAKPTQINYTVVYVLGPLLGGFLAGIFQKIVYEFAIKHAEEASNQEYGKMVQ
jgi:glycerol uptake facilitator-like aquaporin